MAGLMSMCLPILIPVISGWALFLAGLGISSAALAISAQRHLPLPAQRQLPLPLQLPLTLPLQLFLKLQ
jgi:hypothetical protein